MPDIPTSASISILDTLAGLPGLSFYVEGGWSFGEDLGRKTGSIFSPAQAFTGRAVRLSRTYLQQDLLEDKLTFKIGRLATEDDFLSSPIYGEYVNAAINSVPGNILESTPGFTTFPSTQWGASAVYKPLEQVRAAIGIYSSDDDDQQGQGTRRRSLVQSRQWHDGDRRGRLPVEARRRRGSGGRARRKAAAGTTRGRAPTCATRPITGATTAASISVSNRWPFARAGRTAPKG